MAQLTADCFACAGPLLPIAGMERLIIERVTPVAEVEQVPLDDTLGRIVAVDVAAPEDLPPFDNSAVDGFAVRHADLAAASDTRLIIAERVMAGHAAAHPLAPREAIRIFTGAPMPVGADTVFMQEDCRVEGNAVIVPPGLERDDPAALETAIASAAADHDLVITSGGVSTGEADHVRTAIERIGRLVFWRVAIKPGRPVAMGVVPGGPPGHAAAFAGLPGNPAAVYVTFVRVVWPLLLRLARAPPPPPIALPGPATLPHPHPKHPPQHVPLPS